MAGRDSFMTKPREEIITRPEDLPGVCAFLKTCDVIGFDTEFVGEDSYHPHLCMVQVAAGDRLILIDPLSVGPLDAFWELLVDPARVVVVHAGREEVRLCQMWGGAPPGNLFDLQVAAGLVGLPYPIGHGTLVGQLLGVRLGKGETLTEWRHRPLTAAQIRYAFDDVRYLLPLWRKLTARLEKLGRTEWAREEFGRLLEAALPEEGTQERWRRLRGLGALDRRRLAVVRALFDWRDQTAARLNRPARTILRDDLIIEVARRNPARERDLHPVRGLQRRFAPDIFAVLQEVRDLPAEQWPRRIEKEQDPPQLALVGNVLVAVLADLCVKMHLASSLVATTSDVKQLVRTRIAGEPLPADVPLTHGWRGEHVLPELLAVLDGQRAVRVADVRAEAPFAYGEPGASAPGAPPGDEGSTIPPGP
jgi:ribonuclease D